MNHYRNRAEIHAVKCGGSCGIVVSVGPLVSDGDICFSQTIDQRRSGRCAGQWIHARFAIYDHSLGADEFIFSVQSAITSASARRIGQSMVGVEKAAKLDDGEDDHEKDHRDDGELCHRGALLAVPSQLAHSHSGNLILVGHVIHGRARRDSHLKRDTGIVD